MATAPVRVHYFPIRGRAEVLRLLLADIGAEWENVKLGGPSFDEFKAQGKSTWGSLPVVEYEGKFLAQTLAILKYIGAKNGRYPEDLDAQYRVDTLIGAAEDLRQESGKLNRMWSSPSEEAIEKFKTAIAPRWLGNIAKFLSENTESAFSTGASVTIADYLLYDALDVARTLVPSSLDAYPRLQEFISAFEARDGIKEYLASERLQGVPPL